MSIVKLGAGLDNCSRCQVPLFVCFGPIFCLKLRTEGIPLPQPTFAFSVFQSRSYSESVIQCNGQEI